MASPTSNSVPYTIISMAGLSQQVQALLSGMKWGGGLGSGVALTYSFPTSAAHSYWATSYSGDNEYTNMSVLDAVERSACQQALTVWANSANITFSKLSDNSTTCGEIRFAISDLGNSGFYAHAYYPGSSPDAGDVWFSSQWNSDAMSSVAPGTYAFTTILHELGHALGLKHPFEKPVTLDAAHDSFFYTIMSYDVKENTPVSSVSADFYPTTPQYYDLLAMETLYGQSPSANPGNTKYVFYGTQHYWQTINDVSGHDTIFYKSSTGGRIDLSNATFSQLGLPIHFSDGAVSYDTVALGPFTAIENATGGSGSDTIFGSDAHNVLNGGGGSDFIEGGKGADRINGGTGRDSFVYAGAGDSTGTKFDTVVAFDASQDVFDVWKAISAIDQRLHTGSLSLASFGHDLSHVLTASRLGAHSAVLYTAAHGDQAGKLFLIVNPTGTAGYQVGQDAVILLDNAANLSHLSVHDFI